MPKDYPRAARLGAQLQQELSEILRAGLLRDPRLYDVNLTVTAVDLAHDLRNALILVSSFGEVAALHEAVKALNHAAGKLRGELGRRLHLRHIPLLAFRADEAGREAEKISRLLRDALTQDQKSATERGEKDE